MNDAGSLTKDFENRIGAREDLMESFKAPDGRLSESIVEPMNARAKS